MLPPPDENGQTALTGLRKEYIEQPASLDSDS